MKAYRTDSNPEHFFDERMQSMVISIVKFRPEIFPKIDAINDHKGILRVFWNTKPDDRDKDFLKVFWEINFEFEIQHFYNGSEV